MFNYLINSDYIWYMLLGTPIVILCFCGFLYISETFPDN